MTDGAADQPHLRRLFDGKLYPLQGDMIIGRHNNCSLVLENEKGASRKHARLSVVNGDVFITDLGSLNGTLVNGTEIDTRYQLANADILIFDEQEYEILLPNSPIDEFDVNMTVIANKAEIANPKLIKPAIRVVDDNEMVRVAAEDADQQSAGPEDEEPLVATPARQPEIQPPPTTVPEQPTPAAVPPEPRTPVAAPPEPRAPAAASPEPPAPVAEPPEPRATAAAPPEPPAPVAEPPEPRAPAAAQPEPPTPVAEPPERRAPAAAPPEPRTPVPEPPEPRAPAAAQPEPSTPAAEPPGPRAPAAAPPEPPTPAAEPPGPRAPAAAQPEPASAPPEPPAPVAAPLEQDSPAAPAAAPAAPAAPAAAPAAPPAASPPVSQRPQPAPGPAAIRPGAWANTSAVMQRQNRTMIASQVLDEHMPPASIDTSMVDEPTLMVQTGDMAGTSFVLAGEMSEWSIGSDFTRNFVINQSGISASHAVIVREGSKWKVCDQMSVNGTFVNGNRTNVSYINSGDIIRCGPVECVFAIPSGIVARGGKNTGMRFPLWMIGAGVAILLVLGGAWFAYSAGLFTKPPPAAVTDSQ